MKRIALGLLLGCLTGSGGASAQSKGENVRPVERPSRAVEELLKRQAAAREAEAAAEAAAAADNAAPSTAKAEAPAPALFRVSGAEVWEVARAAGWKFFPKGAKGARDGRNTVAEVQPGLAISLVQGPVLTQRRTPAGWSVISENTFYLFADAAGRAKSLAPGWTVRDLRLSGDPFEWVTKPKAGAASPSLAIIIRGLRSPRDSVVRLDGVILQGPPGAKDWREAFGKP
jgi:hypothetical protein